MKHRTRSLAPVLVLLLPTAFAPALSACGGDSQGPGKGLELPGPDVKTDVPSDGLTSIDTSKDSQPNEDIGPTPDTVTPDVPACEGIDAEPCSTPGARRCASEGAVVETCKDLGGCLGWAADTPCLTLNKCTGVADVCVDGACVPPEGLDPNASCEQPTQPCKESVCNPQTGLCAIQNANDHTPCNDFDVCTDDDICFNGVCQGTPSCPKGCQTESLACGSALIFDLNSQATDLMSAYGCEGAEAGAYAGWERSFIASSLFDCEDAELSVELTKPGEAGSKFVDLVALGTNNGICWPSECVDLAQMDDAGRAQLVFDLIKNQNLVLVADGRDGYFGKVRLSLSCCGQQVEAFCGDGIDNDGDGLTDCADDDCAGFACNNEFHCSDGIDNDGNGLTDCDDPQCAEAEECNVETNCADGIDDDGDGATDCDDVDCVGTAACATQCLDAPVLSCGSVLKNQVISATSIIHIDGWDCPENSGEVPGLVDAQLAFRLAPDAGCSGTFSVEVESPSDYEAMVLAPGCDGDQCVQYFTSLFAGTGPKSLATSEIPGGWLVISPFVADGFEPVTVSMTCTCQ